MFKPKDILAGKVFNQKWNGSSGSSSKIRDQLDEIRTVLAINGINLTPDDEMSFITTGSTFSPVITLNGDADVKWIFGENSSSSPAPDINFGSASLRGVRLKVTPWSAVRRINLGYDKSADGSSGIEIVPPQQVTAIYNLDLVKDTLVEFCYSGNSSMPYLNLDGFRALKTIECFNSTGLKEVKLDDCFSVKRACFEGCGLEYINMRSFFNIEDIRISRNAFRYTGWPETANSLKIIQSSNGTGTVLTSYPNLRILDYSGSTGNNKDIRLTQKNLILVDFSNTYITSLDLSAATFLHSGGRVNLDNSRITSLNLGTCENIKELHLKNTLITELDISQQSSLTYIDLENHNLTLRNMTEILDKLDSYPMSSDIKVACFKGNTEYDVTCRNYISSLKSKGWTVS